MIEPPVELPGLCPNCGEPLRKGRNGWWWWCENCPMRLMWGSGAPPDQKGEDITTAQVASMLREDAKQKLRAGGKSGHSSGGKSRRFGKKKAYKKQEIWTLC